MVDTPAARRPVLLGDEDRRHELLEHAAAPPGHDVHATVRVGALVDRDAEVGARLAHRLHLVPRPVTGRREGAPRREVVLRGDLAGQDAEVARDARLGDDRVVVVRREPDVAPADVRAPVDAAGAVVVEDVEATVHEAARTHHWVPAEAVPRVVEGVPPHAGEDRGRQRSGHGIRVLDDEQRGAEPAVVDARHERVHRGAVLGPDEDRVAGGLVVPVVVHATRLVVLHPFERGEGAHEASPRVGGGDDSQLPRDDGRPQIPADVRRRRVPGAVPGGERRGDVVGGEPGVRVRHGVEAVPGVGCPAVQARPRHWRIPAALERARSSGGGGGAGVCRRAQAEGGERRRPADEQVAPRGEDGRRLALPVVAGGWGRGVV